MYRELEFKGLVDTDIELKQRRIIHEQDRDFETETSKNYYSSSLINYFFYRLVPIIVS